MSSAFLTVRDAIVTALLDTPQIVGSRVRAGRGRSLPQTDDNDIAVFVESCSGQDFAIGGGPKDWAVTYGVRIRARGSSTVDAETACDALLEDVYERLEATAAPNGVEAFNLEARIDTDTEEADTPIGVCTLYMTALMRTQAGALTLAP